jgi:Icc-related predicted phosphoesterase
MIRRLSAIWPSAADGEEIVVPPVRLLAVSDEMEPALSFETNRRALLPVDGVIGAGDLKPEYLDFLADAFKVPLLYVRGNHDRGGGWEEEIDHVPEPMDGTFHDLGGVTLAGLSWPSDDHGRAVHDDNAAWRQVASSYMRFRSRRPLVMVSHVPPAGLGDTPDDHYHRGFAAYRWLCERLKPLVWIHGHTSTAAAQHWWVQSGPTTVVNVTGAVLLEVGPAQSQPTVIGVPGVTIAEGLLEPANEGPAEAH